MRQLLQIFRFDIKMTFKNFMGGYMVIIPMAILLILRLFLPTVESTTASFAVVNEGENAVSREIIDLLDDFGDISFYADIESMERKLRGSGTVEGLYYDPVKEQYVSVLERKVEENKLFSLSSRFIRQYEYKKSPDAVKVTVFTSGVPEELASRSKTSPVATIGGSTFLVFMIIISAFMIGLSIVEDKEDGTIFAIRSSPVSPPDYFIGKSLFPFLIMLFYTIVDLLVMGLMHVNIIQVYWAVLISFSVTLLFGLLVGSIGNNEVEAIGIGKILSMVLMLAIVGATLLPDKWQWAVWWSPVYWTYEMLEGIFSDTISWKEIAIDTGALLSLILVYFMLLRKKIISGLS